MLDQSLKVPSRPSVKKANPNLQMIQRKKLAFVEKNIRSLKNLIYK